MPSQRISAPDVASSWHQDFMNQQGPAAHLQSSQHQDRFGATPAYGMSSFVRPGFQPASFGMMGGSGKSMSEVSQGKQRASESIPQLDAAAFERAFAAAQQAEEEAYTESQRQQQSQKGDAVADDLLQEEEDAALARIREKRPAVYAALKIRSAVELRTPSKASQFLDVLETMEINHELTKDASEARWVVDTLQKIAEEDIPQDVKTRSEKLIRAINERLMSTYPLLSTPAAMNSDRIWEELEAAGYIKPRESEQILQPEPRLEQKEEGQQYSQHDDDEMAQTAGHLLERVSDNTSEKFKNSQFLSLMRRLRDREVRVEGDKMVEVSTAQSTSSSSPSLPQSFQSQVPSQSTEADPASGFEHFNDIYPPSGMDWGWYDPPSPAALPATMVPPIDPNILEHAATDFAAPVYSGEEQQEYATLSREPSLENVTDEVLDQYRYCNIHSAYQNGDAPYSAS